MSAFRRLLDWHTRSVMARCGLPDVPEVRALLRASWWRGFTFGSYPSPEEMAAIRQRALDAIRAAQ